MNNDTELTPEISSYEGHITIEPVFGDRFLQFEEITARYRFRPAELLLWKQREATPLRSNKDSFCTSHSRSYADLLQRTNALVDDLECNGFDVWRHKIEGILLDVRTPPLVNIQRAATAAKAVAAGWGMIK